MVVSHFGHDCSLSAAGWDRRDGDPGKPTDTSPAPLLDLRLVPSRTRVARRSLGSSLTAWWPILAAGTECLNPSSL